MNPSRVRLRALALIVGLTMTSPALTLSGAGAAASGSTSPTTTTTATSAPTAEGKRVDLDRPSFSHPTRITNPLFPISKLRRTVLLGTSDGVRQRAETTLLPGTKSIKWHGQQVETLVSQYVGYLDGRIHELAYDFYAQADDGSVWYFGEDVFNYERGVIVNTEAPGSPAGTVQPA